MNSATQANEKLVFELVKDHLKLAGLELEYSKERGWRRLLIMGGGAIFILSAFILFNVALIHALLKGGMTWAGASLLLGVLYLFVGGGIFFFSRKQSSEEEGFFQASREELQRSATWIEKHFF